MLARSHTRYWPRSNHPSSNTCKMSQRYIRLTGPWERRFCSLLRQSSHVAWRLQIHISIFVSTNLRGDSLMASHRQLYKSWWQAYFYTLFMYFFHTFLLPQKKQSGTLKKTSNSLKLSNSLKKLSNLLQKCTIRIVFEITASFLRCIPYTVLQ